MYEKLIKEYINRLTEEDIKKFAVKNDIILNDEEAKIIYLYSKNYWIEFYKGDPTEILSELKGKLRPQVFDKLNTLYVDNKNKFR